MVEAAKVAEFYELSTVPNILISGNSDQGNRKKNKLGRVEKMELLDVLRIEAYGDPEKQYIAYRGRFRERRSPRLNKKPPMDQNASLALWRAREHAQERGRRNKRVGGL